MLLSKHFKNNESAFAMESGLFACCVQSLLAETKLGSPASLIPPHQWLKVTQKATNLQRICGLVCFLLQVSMSFTYLSIFGFQPELCPARGFQAARLGVDLDAFWSLHHQSPCRWLQSVRERGVGELGASYSHALSQALILHSLTVHCMAAMAP